MSKSKIDKVLSQQELLLNHWLSLNGCWPPFSFIKVMGLKNASQEFAREAWLLIRKVRRPITWDEVKKSLRNNLRKEIKEKECELHQMKKKLDILDKTFKE